MLGWPFEEHAGQAACNSGARLQYKVGGRVGDQIGQVLMVAAPDGTSAENVTVFAEMTQQEAKASP